MTRKNSFTNLEDEASFVNVANDNKNDNSYYDVLDSVEASL